jgi:tripartite-type tricarboxylate transporter receptor subunit TctC
MLAPALVTALGQSVVIDNRPSGAIQGETLVRSAPDGYTLLICSGNLWISALTQDLSFDPLRDFAPITLAGISPSVLVVHPSLPVKSVKDLIALARAKPGQINYGTAAAGAPGLLAAELMKSMAHINLVRVPYKGGGPVLIGLLSGEVQMAFLSAPNAAAHVQAGKLRAVAVTSAEPSALVPGLPTVAASGLPGYESGATYGMFAPAKTPAAIIAVLNREMVKFLKSPEGKQKLLTVGVDALGTTPEQFTVVIKNDMVKWGKLIKDAGIRVE